MKCLDEIGRLSWANTSDLSNVKSQKRLLHLVEQLENTGKVCKGCQLQQSSEKEKRIYHGPHLTIANTIG